MSANEIPNQFKSETRKMYNLHVAGTMISSFNSSNPPLVGSFGPVIRDRIVVGIRTFDVMGVGDVPVGKVLETKLYLAEVITNA